MLHGAHCSGGIKKSLDRAAELEADSLQLFVQSPRMWRFPDHDPKDLAAFRASGIEVLRTSAKDGRGVEESFAALGRRMLGEGRP